LRSPEGYIELGEGVIEFEPLIALLNRTDYNGWIMAELDEATRPAREAAQISWDYLTTSFPELF
jgi:sugar phosphate isomerase/epimerase